MGARQVLEARTFTLMMIGAIVVTLALRIPGRGVIGAAGALALVMTGYGELLRRGSQGDWTARPRGSLSERAWRLFLCLGAGGALALPLFLAQYTQAAPRVTRSGLALASGLILIVPLVMLATYGARGPLGDRMRVVGSMLARHPVAVLASLLLLPLSLIAIEWSLFTMTRYHGSFGYFTLDLFPQPDGLRVFQGIPYLGPFDYRSADDSPLLGLYTGALKQGYTFVGTIPASLALPFSNGFNTEWVFNSPGRYLLLRMLFTVFIVTCMLAGLAIQARWLGLLSTMDSRRPAS